MIGFAPYGVLAIRTVVYGGQQLSMLASVIPPLAAKASTIFCPVVYCVSSKQFREAFTAMTIGSSVPKKIEWCNSIAIITFFFDFNFLHFLLNFTFAFFVVLHFSNKFNNNHYVVEFAGLSFTWSYTP